MRFVGSTALAATVLFTAAAPLDAGAAGVRRVVLEDIDFSPATVSTMR